MAIRPAVLFFLYVSSLVLSVDAFAGSADHEVYTQCLNKELAQLETIKAACAMDAANSAQASTTPGQNSEETTGSGLAADCIGRSETAVRQRAAKKCSEQAYGAMIERATADPDEPAAAGAETSASICKPSPGHPCSSVNDSGAAKARANMAPGLAPKAAPQAKVGKSASSQSQAAASKPSANSAAKPSQSSTRTDQNNREALTSAKNTTPQTSDLAGSSASNDIALCEDSYSSASRCCGNPASCVRELPYQDQVNYAQLSALTSEKPTPGGLPEYCQQLQSLGGRGGGVNSSLAGLCNSKQMSCHLVCSQLAGKYQALISNCAGCSAQDIYENAYAQINSRVSSCQAFASRVAKISDQAIGSSAGAGYGDLCNNVATSDPKTSAPSTAMPGSPTNAQNQLGQGSSNDIASGQNCLANPKSPACRAMENKVATGTAQFDDSSANAAAKKRKSEFNVPSLDDVFTERVLDGDKSKSGAAVKTKAVANNTGGSIPGGDGVQPASLGANRAAGASPGAPGYSTDILQGTHGGEGYSNPVEANLDPGSRGYGGRKYAGVRGPAAGGDEHGGLLGLDLRQFLPGGSRDPKRRLAGLGPRSEINSKEEDIWRRISSKIEEKCKLGVLMGCQ